ncbi:NADH-quinone oxidoreductase subunit J [Edaphobacter aggregans]|uniref:NADH-quinone oxidoreductase subunit J n=1 Tax=Edaphobacter aggregans TaxID=570835 RepID=UPI0005580AE3|nr:NADH-quinone oxidoreductase subunit J [Edaphobacter aggregans]
MTLLFYLAGILAVVATLLAITQRHAVHALLYLIVSLLAVAADFYALGAPFVAALEIMIYAGAIMVLFVFVVMMLNLAEHAMEVEREGLKPRNWAGPALLALVLLGELAFCAALTPQSTTPMTTVGPKQVGIALFGDYWIGVELASLLLMAGLVGAFHLGRHAIAREETQHATSTDRAHTDSRSDLVSAGSRGTSHAA